MDTGELFEDGDCQAIRLPPEYRLPGDKVYIKRHGNGIMIFPEGSGWQPLLDALDKFDDDFMADWKPVTPETNPELGAMFD